MQRILRLSGLGALAATLLLLAASCSGDTGALEKLVDVLKRQVQTLEGEIGKPAITPGDKTFFISAIRVTGTTTTDKLAPPDRNPKTISDGFGYKAPGAVDPKNPAKWQVSSYIWSPGTMMAFQGDKIGLEIFIVNGDKHAAYVEGPDGIELMKGWNQYRGVTYTFGFTAEKVGLYKLICTIHAPTMTANILVLPRP